MKKCGWWVLVLALLWLAGCCSHPGIFQKVETSMETVQNFYEPLLQDNLEKNETWKLAVVAADTTLLLAGELQNQWCPDPAKAEQLALQTQQAQELAQQVGVAAAGTTPASPAAPTSAAPATPAAPVTPVAPAGGEEGKQ